MNPMVKVDVDICINVNFPQSEPGHSTEVLTAIREIGSQMTTLQDKINELTADDFELAADVNALVSIINDIPARIQAAVVEALTAAGVSDEAVTAALNGVDATVKAAIEAAKSVLPATATPPEAGADTAEDTTPGDDTVGGGDGSDTTGDAGGTDTNDAPGSTSDGQGEDPAVPPPSASGGSVPPASDQA